jgi:hypothetical protein
MVGSSASGFRGRPIAARPLLPEQFEEQAHRFLFRSEVMNHLLAPRTDPAPASRQTGVPEQGWLDGHGIVAGHVLRWLGSFDIELIGLRDHVGIVAHRDFAVQRML